MNLYDRGKQCKTVGHFLLFHQLSMITSLEYKRFQAAIDTKFHTT
jgi:hypothetical protein